MNHERVDFKKKTGLKIDFLDAEERRSAKEKKTKTAWR